MKNKILALTVLGLAYAGLSNEAKAQATGQANLTVALSDVVALTVASPNVSIPFTTAAHYQTGNSTTQTNHVSVTSTGDYIVKVKALAGNLTDGSNNIPVSTIAVTPTVASGNAPGLSNVSGLTTTGQALATSTTGGTVETVFNIQYTASGGSDYVNKPAGNYTATIEYSIEPN